MAINHVVVLIGVSGPGAAYYPFSWQRIQWPELNPLTSEPFGDILPRLVDVRVERNFTPQSLYGIQTGANKYTIELANSDGALDLIAPQFVGQLGNVSTGTNPGALVVRHAIYIERVTRTSTSVILDCVSAIERFLSKFKATEFYSTTFPLGKTGIPARPWNAGHCTYDVDPISISGAFTDFDAGSRPSEILTVFVDGSVVTPLTPLGSGAFALATTAVDGKRVTVRSDEPSTAAKCEAGTAFRDLMDRIYGGSGYVDTWARGGLDDTSLIGVAVLEETMLETIEKILCGYDGALIMRADAQPAVALLDLDGTPVAEFVIDRNGPNQFLISNLELEDSAPDGLGKVITWNQNAAQFGRSDTEQTDPNNILKPNFSAQFADALAHAYDTDDIKVREFTTYFYESSTTIAGPITEVKNALIASYENPYNVVSFVSNGHELKQLNPGDTVTLTHPRFGIGTDHKHQILSIRYSECALPVSFTTIGAYP